MSDVISAKVNNTISPALRGVNSISMKDDIIPAMRRTELIVKDTLRGFITNNMKGYNLGSHARKGVLSKEWALTTQSRTFGYTVYLSPREWLYIFNGGTYKTGIRRTKKAYKTGPHTDKLGRHYKERRFSPGVRRGAIPALNYLDETRTTWDGIIFDQLRSDIARAVEARLQKI